MVLAFALVVSVRARLCCVCTPLCHPCLSLASVIFFIYFWIYLIWFFFFLPRWCAPAILWFALPLCVYVRVFLYMSACLRVALWLPLPRQYFYFQEVLPVLAAKHCIMQANAELHQSVLAKQKKRFGEEIARLQVHRFPVALQPFRLTKNDIYIYIDILKKKGKKDASPQLFLHYLINPARSRVG